MSLNGSNGIVYFLVRAYAHELAKPELDHGNSSPLHRGLIMNAVALPVPRVTVSPRYTEFLGETKWIFRL